MKNSVFYLSVFILAAGRALYAAPPTANPQPSNQAPSQQQTQTMQEQPMEVPECSQLSPAEAQFANQLTDPANKILFCTQFTPQQRKEAMQMVGKPDAMGNRMSADQAVQQLGGGGASIQPGRRPGGACPVK